jgi:hypothetical protein
VQASQFRAHIYKVLGENDTCHTHMQGDAVKYNRRHMFSIISSIGAYDDKI